MSTHYKVPVFDKEYRERLAWNDRGKNIGVAMLAALQEKYFQAQPYGPDGCAIAFIKSQSAHRATSSVIVSRFVLDGMAWVHASIAHTDRMPSYVTLAVLHKAVFAEGFAYQVFAPSAQHINIHDYALHLWGLDNGEPALPNFGAVLRTI